MAYGEEKKEKTDDKKTLDEVKEYFKQCVTEEDTERAKMKDDLRFCTLDQWPDDIKKARENSAQEGGARPCLTIDKINQYIVQVVNDVRQGRPGINVRPQDDAADPETARILKGIVRNIEDQSSADIAYATAIESAAKIGVGYFRIITEYVDDESFDQEIFIKPIANTFSVYLGKHSMPDGSDAEHGFVVESLPIEKFRQMYPKAKWAHEEFSDLDPDVMGSWKTDETITVVEYYCLKRVEEKLHFLEDGTTTNDEHYRKWPENNPKVGPRPPIRESRTTYRKQLKWSKCTAVEVLESRDLPGKYIPIVEVVGREGWIDGKRVLWGLVRPAKDSLRMYNYWASTITEKLALAPKTPFVGAKGQFEGLEDRWRKANTMNYAYLEYNPIDVQGNPLPAPERQGATPMEAAYMNYMQVIERDVQTSLGMFKASVGETESQQSGRAILALQRESDTATYHFGANLGQSIRHAGRIIVDMIPHYYDTKRVVRIMGEDGDVRTATLDPELPVPYQQTAKGGTLFNPGMGKYDVSITVGPSYNTKRMEAQATFVELAKGAADPISAALLRYLTVKNSDFEGATEAGKAFRALLPPPVQEALAGGKLSPEAQAVVAQAKMQIEALQKELEEEKAGTRVQAMKVQADQQAKAAELQLEAKKAAEEARLEEEKMKHEFMLKEKQAALEAQIKAQQFQMESHQFAQSSKLDTAKAKHEFKMKRLQGANPEGNMDPDKAKEIESEFDAEVGGVQAVDTVQTQVIPMLQQTLGQMLQALQAMQQTQLAILEESKKPRQVSLGGVQRDQMGQIAGANVVVH
jgi:hypothetical protein